MTATAWSIVGSTTAWDALDDPVTETEVPSNADYISTSATSGSRRVGMTTTKVGGASVLNPRVWWYTSTAAAVEVQVYGTGGAALAKTVASGIGWHSLPFSLNGSQSQVDALYLDFRPNGAAGTRTVSAAFIRFDVEPRVLWGSWIDGDVYTKEGEPPKGDAPWTKSTWETFNTHAGKNPSIIHFGQPAPWWASFQEAPLRYSREGNALPMMDMDIEEPLVYEEGGQLKEKRVTLDMITAGAVDPYLEDWAEDVAAYGYPFFFRWNWEMNGPWFDYGEEAIAEPADFIDAWRHFHDIAEAKGATNITWVWCPNVTRGLGGEPSITTYYPGSKYVDWTCLDGYNWGTNPVKPQTWQSFSTIYSPSYNALATSYPEKPIMIGEVGSTESGGSKSSWISDLLEVQLPTNFPKIKAMVWFNWNVPENGSRMDWQIESSAGAEAAFAKGISSPYYSTDSFGSPLPLTRIQPLP